MKAPDFDYVRVRSLDEALAALAAHGEGARILAGGQSLVPALNLRLLAPEILVDIGGIADLSGIALADGTIRIGAMTRHADLERSPEIARHVPLLARAVREIGHPAIRNRGTIGGSLAHADPASELPACVLALEARIVARGPSGERTIAASDFFRGLYETALGPDEILVRIEIPAAAAGERFAFHELARRHGDYAMAGIAALARDTGAATLRIAYFGIGSRPMLAAGAAAALRDHGASEAGAAAAVRALGADLEPQSDLQASAALRMHLAGVLLRRALKDLFPDAAGGREEEIA
ncbi:FAD binding domain-containing protein [Propylenella binzhouense]|uniref:Xanthine dehydrogenase family protein subunit M n=1 Tax=Propylenella binzhouense TaxID=2555902 RepID=A0A964T6R8_9HYPH|nr:xanthine dehydrogenase family protein subunit M [Propylenella binzhouense]